MIKTAAQKPQDRMRFIEQAAAEQARQADPTVCAMGLRVDPKMMEVLSMIPLVSRHVRKVVFYPLENDEDLGPHHLRLHFFKPRYLHVQMFTRREM